MMIGHISHSAIQNAGKMLFAEGAPTVSEIRAANRNAVGGARKRCRKGKNCSAACIASNEYCLVGLPESVGVSTTKVRNMLEQRLRGKMPTPAAPTPASLQPSATDQQLKAQAKSILREGRPPSEETPLRSKPVELRPPSPQRKETVTAEEVKVSQPKEKGSYYPRDPGDEKGVKAKWVKNSGGLWTPFEADKYEAQLEKIKEGKKVKKQGRTMQEEEIRHRLSKVKENVAFVKRLEEELPKDIKMEQVSSGTISLIKTTKNGDKVELMFSPSTTNFQVNGNFSTMDGSKENVTGRAAQMEVASTLRTMWDSVVRALPVGAMTSGIAWDADGKQEGRARVYQRMGFSPPTSTEQQYTVKMPDGSMRAPQGDPEKAFRDFFYQDGGMYFSEDATTYYRMSDKQKDLLWWEAIFGVNT